jgi:hypothetical protein
MSLIHRSKRLFALLAFATFVPAIAQVPSQTTPTPNIVTAKIKLDDLSMIIVPVSINGSGPYDFLLDTGSSKTIVDRKLADELGLPHVGEKTLAGVMTSARMSVVHLNSLSVGGATVPGGDVLSSDRTTTVTGKVRGVLGEDFLQNFDLLIDYRQRVIRLDAPLGAMAEAASGERLPMQLTGTLHGQPTHNRLVVSGQIAELGDTPLRLQLDSGANGLTLFRDTLGQNSNQQERVRLGSFDKWVSSSAATGTVRSLSLGSSSVLHLTAIALPQRADADTDGLVPTSLFKAVLISSRGGFVILNPSFSKVSR